MKTPYFKSIEFWTREFRLPLFWLPKIIGNNSLALYKNSVLHIYYLNNRHTRAASAGYKFFTDKKNAGRYGRQTRDILNEIGGIKAEYENINIKKISDVGLEKRFSVVMGFLNRYASVYTKTEAVYLEKLGDEKFDNLRKKLGEARFSLRKGGEPVFYIFLGVLLKEIGRRFGVKTGDLFFYTDGEIKRLFRNKTVTERIIRLRSRGYALIITGNKGRLLVGDEFKKLHRDVVLTKKTDELSGRAVMPGKVRGRVRLILHNKRNIADAVKKFEKGEILVTEMTRPDTIMACRKAAAIVTDEGGLTSHAAIISRELKIPCIVGTKNATQILKDGDLVEVDAERGIVRLMKSGT